jgi:hypothetical protein
MTPYETWNTAIFCVFVFVRGLTTIFLVGELGVEDQQKGHLAFLKEKKH